jgi:hypothetical protein
MGSVFGQDASSLSQDIRKGASDQAQLNDGSGLIFNGGGSKQAAQVNYVPWIIGAVVSFMIWTFVIRK